MAEPKQTAASARVNIENEASEAVKVVASAAAEATKVIANAAAEAVKVNSAKSVDDHDLLIKISTLIGVMQNDITEIKSGTSSKIDDHELRIKKLENKVANYFITVTLYSIAIAGTIATLATHLLNTK